MVIPISGSVEEIPFHGVAIQMKPFWLTTFTYCLRRILLNFYFGSFGSEIVKIYICVCLFLIDQLFFRWPNTVGDRYQSLAYEFSQPKNYKGKQQKCRLYMNS